MTDFEKEYESYYQETEETLEFIWGLKSYDDLTKSDACIYTMNDIDITYNKTEKKYYIGIETVYEFRNGSEGKKQYIKALFIKLTEWMISQGYNINKQLDIYEVFTQGNIDINKGFNTIEDLYTTFKFLVNGFINQNNN